MHKDGAEKEIEIFGGIMETNFSRNSKSSFVLQLFMRGTPLFLW